MKPNIYIRSLEIGDEHSAIGISYNDLKSKLLTEEYFINRYYANYFERYQFPHYHGIRYGNNYRKFSDFNEETKNRKCVLASHAYFNLIEYQDLIETKKSSKQANRNSLIAILLTLVAIIISIFA